MKTISVLRTFLLAGVTLAVLGYLSLQFVPVSMATAPSEIENERVIRFPTPTPDTGTESDPFRNGPVCRIKQEDRQPAFKLPFMADIPCEDGMAGQFQCENVDLMSLMPLSMIGGGEGNDIWGWTDPETGNEYAIMGRTNGTAFVDVTDPIAPVYLGNLPSHTTPSIFTYWRDIKVYQNHAYIVADNIGNHGVQVFDLTQLRDVTSPPQTFAETAHYGEIGSAHNIAINEDTGYAYVVGGSSGAQRCNGGLHMVSLRRPASPAFAGCFSSDGYTHDTQCVIYEGPDSRYQGQEVCFNANEDTITIVDVTDKGLPALLSRTPYDGSAYTHQGWLTEDHRYFLSNDEQDEDASGHNTRTYIWDVQDLRDPELIGEYTGPVPSIDHNLYTHEGYVYEANYQSGLRVLDLSDVANGNLSQSAYFDLYPTGNAVGFNGAWSVYPYFESGNVIVSGIEQGLLVLRPHLQPAELTPTPSATATVSPSVTPTGTVTPDQMLYLPVMRR